MTIKGGFFEAVETSPGVFDRVYLAAEYAKRWADGFSDGVFLTDVDTVNELNKVSKVPGTMNTEIAVGPGLILGYGYEVTATETITHVAADPSNPRIDRIVIEWNNTEPIRDFVTKALEGTPAASPVAPALTRTSEIHQIAVGEILIPANVSDLDTATLTDTRGDETLCGFSKPTGQENFENENNFAQYEKDVTVVDGLGLPTEVQYKRPSDSSLAIKQTASNPDGNGYYQTVVEEYYKADGVTVYKTITYTLTFLSNGIIDTSSRVVVLS